MRHKKIGIIVCSLITLAAIGTGCFFLFHVGSMGPAGSKALYIYMCGSTLESEKGAASANVAEMLDMDIPEDTQIILETGGSKSWENSEIAADKLERFQLENGKLVKLEEKQMENMGIANTLYDFLNYSVTNYPAEKMGVILWNHGGGGVNGVCNDENYGMDSLSLKEMDAALDAVREDMSDDFEMIGFDACLMADYETASVVSKYARNMVASQELEVMGGWDYKELIQNFGTENGYEKIIQGYADKCEDNGKNAYTLSHIDLSDFASIQDTFSQMAKQLNSLDDLKNAVLAAKDAVSFGYNSKAEGYSNLVDLQEFAESMKCDELKKALKSKITCVNGSNRQQANGLSFMYPLMNTHEMKGYIKLDINADYKTFLTKNYLNIPEKTIELTDTGSEKSGETHVEVTPESQKYIQSVTYRLYRFVPGESEYEEHVFCMGNDSDVLEDGDNGYTSSFGGKWPVWKNQYICCYAVDSNKDVTIFSTSVKVNGQKGVIRFSYDISKEKIEILGFIKESEKTVTERLETLKPTDQITLLFDERTDSYDESLFECEKFLYKEAKNIKLEVFPDGYFQNYITITDIFGKEYYSNSMVYEWKDGRMKFVAKATDEDEQDD